MITNVLRVGPRETGSATVGPSLDPLHGISGSGSAPGLQLFQTSPVSTYQSLTSKYFHTMYVWMQLQRVELPQRSVLPRVISETCCNFFPAWGPIKLVCTTWGESTFRWNYNYTPTYANTPPLLCMTCTDQPSLQLLVPPSLWQQTEVVRCGPSKHFFHTLPSRVVLQRRFRYLIVMLLTLIYSTLFCGPTFFRLC